MAGFSSCFPFSCVLHLLLGNGEKRVPLTPPLRKKLSSWRGSLTHPGRKEPGTEAKRGLGKLLGRWNDYYRYFQSKEKIIVAVAGKRWGFEQARSEGREEASESPELEQLRHFLNQTREALHEKEEMIVNLHRRLREREQMTHQKERNGKPRRKRDRRQGQRVERTEKEEK